jgi:hypothetical protein
MNREAFFALAEAVRGRLQGDEILFANLGVERSDFVRQPEPRAPGRQRAPPGWV